MPVSMHVNIIGAEMVRDGLEELGQSIPRISRLRIYSTLVRARSRLKQTAPRPKYPINWDSERQRRVFFATRGFGGGIPYRRTGRYQRGWNVVRNGETGYRLENNSSGAEFIGGDFLGQRQSRIHQSRYPVANEVLADEIDTLPAEIENNISSEARRMFA